MLNVFDLLFFKLPTNQFHVVLLSILLALHLYVRSPLTYFFKTLIIRQIKSILLVYFEREREHF
jgi:hypothetical protein